MRSPLRFLGGFAEGLAEPIKLDGRQHIEYVPTQILTEYVRYNHRGHKIRGLLYSSSRRPKGVNCALFCGPRECGAEPATKESELWLRLDPKSVKLVPAGPWRR